MCYILYVKSGVEPFDQAEYNNQLTLQSITQYLSSTQSDQEKLNTIRKKLKYYRGLLENPDKYLSLKTAHHDEDDFTATISCDIGSQEVTILYPTGGKGEKGLQGPSGETGIQGPTGKTGQDGRQGTNQSYLPY